MGETPNQGYNLPEQGQENWHEPLNDNFSAIDEDITKTVSRLSGDENGITAVSEDVRGLVFGKGLSARDDPEETDEIVGEDGRVLVESDIEVTNSGEGEGEVVQGVTNNVLAFRTIQGVGLGVPVLKGLGPASGPPFNTIDFKSLLSVGNGVPVLSETQPPGEKEVYFNTLKNVGGGAEVLAGFLDGDDDTDIDFRTLKGGDCIDVSQLNTEIRISWDCPLWVPVDDGDDNDSNDKVTPQYPDGTIITGIKTEASYAKEGGFGKFGIGDSDRSFRVEFQPASSGLAMKMDTELGENVLRFEKPTDSDPSKLWMRGDLQVAGSKDFVETVDTDEGPKEVAYSATEADTPHTETSGVAELEDGRVEISLPEHFAWVTSEEEPLMIQTTPYSADSAGLAVVERSLERLVIEDLDSTGQYEFAYTVRGTREGYEDKEVVSSQTVGPDSTPEPGTADD